MSNIKISIIGAGSGAFSMSLIKDICLTPKLHGSTICFMDINKERLEAVYCLCTRYAAEMGTHLKLDKTLDRNIALQGADFVINTALAASHQRLQDGWEIARKHGYRLAGSFHVLYDEAFWINYYQYKLFESITEDMLRICPDAWHLMVANPVISGITHLTRKYPGAKIVGLCHGFNAVYQVAHILGLEKEHITYEIPGVNHFVWLNSFYYKGENAFPILDDWIRNKAEEHWSKNTWDELNPKLVDLYKRFGVLPIGDTASWGGASWPWWYHSDEVCEKSWGQDPLRGWNRYFTGVKANAEEIIRLSRDPAVKLTDIFEPAHSSEPMIPLVEAIACDIPRVIVTNIQNSGEFVAGIPRDFEVEIPTLVSRRGIQGIKTKDLPRNVIAHILRDRVVPVELELEAYRKQSRDLLLELVLTDKWTYSLEQANKLIDDIFALPYHDELREYYK